MTSAGPSGQRLNDKMPPKRRLKWGCITAPGDGDADQGEGPAVLTGDTCDEAQVDVHNPHGVYHMMHLPGSRRIGGSIPSVGGVQQFEFGGEVDVGEIS